MVYAPPPAERRRWIGGWTAGAAAGLGLFGLLLVASSRHGKFGGMRTSWKQSVPEAQSVGGAPLTQTDARYQFSAPAPDSSLAYTALGYTAQSPTERDKMMSSLTHEETGALPAAGGGNRAPGFMIRLCWDAFDDGTDVAPSGWSSCANESARCTTDEVVAAGCRSTCAVATGQPCITEAKSVTQLGEERATSPIQNRDPILQSTSPSSYVASAKIFSSSTVDSAMGVGENADAITPHVLSGEDKQSSVFTSMPLQPALSAVQKKKTTTTTLEQQNFDPYSKLD